MLVSVKLHGILRRQHPGPDGHEPLQVEMPPGSVVADLVLALGLPSPRVFAASVNYETVPLDHPLGEGDSVSLFPPVAGGWTQESSFNASVYLRCDAGFA